MNMTPVYISFDYDKDRSLKEFVIEQSRNLGSRFQVVDHSIKVAVSGDWVADAEKRIKKSDIVLVMVGRHTHNAQGVKKEVALARKHDIKVVQMIGYRDSNPTPVKDAGRLYRWNRENLESIFQ